MEHRANKNQFIPTPEEIKEACEQIRSEWTPEKWRNQQGATPWKVPSSGNPDFKTSGID